MTQPARDEPIDAYLKRIFGSDEIKPGREDAILRNDPTLAREVEQRLAAEPLPEGVLAPITHAIPTSSPPVKYIIHVWTHKCSMCQTEHKHSEVFALNHIRTGYRGTDGAIRPGSTWVRNMTPVARLEWQVPVDVIPVTTRVTAGCFECLDALRTEVLPTLPLPPVPQAVTGSGGTGAQAPARLTSDGASKKRPLTTDDFLV